MIVMHLVVAHEVEGGHAHELRMERFILEHREVMLFEIGVDEPLHRAHAVHDVGSLDGERHDAPAEVFAELVGGDFSPAWGL